MVYRILIRLCDIDMLSVMVDRIITAGVGCRRIRCENVLAACSKNRRYRSLAIVVFFLLMMRVIDICLFWLFFLWFVYSF